MPSSLTSHQRSLSMNYESGRSNSFVGQSNPDTVTRTSSVLAVLVLDYISQEGAASFLFSAVSLSRSSDRMTVMQGYRSSSTVPVFPFTARQTDLFTLTFSRLTAPHFFSRRTFFPPRDCESSSPDRQVCDSIRRVLRRFICKSREWSRGGSSSQGHVGDVCLQG